MIHGRSNSVTLARPFLRSGGSKNGIRPAVTLPVGQTWERPSSGSGSESGEDRSTASPSPASAGALTREGTPNENMMRTLARRESEPDLTHLPPPQRLLETFQNSWDDFELFAEYAEGARGDDNVYSVRTLVDHPQS